MSKIYVAELLNKRLQLLITNKLSFIIIMMITEVIYLYHYKEATYMLPLY
ncbi:hypothetical protein IHV12_17825 [Fictibacillus sp. 7GRE50]|nr:hypothetical protein [Fictibacillus sp. 7GRE50]MBH0166782.1 hypothetical protein [Fictibacillus sp. 7GRE50]